LLFSLQMYSIRSVPACRVECPYIVNGGGVSARIIHHRLIIKMIGIRASIALGHMQLAGVRVTRKIEPEQVIESDRIHHQSVPVPFADGIAVPGRIRVRGMARPVQENLAIAVNIPFKEEEDAGGSRHNLPGIGRLAWDRTSPVALSALLFLFRWNGVSPVLALEAR